MASPEDEIPNDEDTEVFNPDAPKDGPLPKGKEQPPIYQVYPDSRIAIGSGVGPYWQRNYEAAVKAYEIVTAVWDEIFAYYGHYQSKELAVQENRIKYKRGDSTENVILTNLNTIVPSLYSQNPDFECSTTDGTEEAFCKTLKAVLNALTKRKDKLGIKSKIKKQIGMGILTNFGITKLDWVKKADSREIAQEEMAQLTMQLEKAKSQGEVEEIVGKLQALDQTIELMDPVGPSLCNVQSKRLVIDPFTEDEDGMDAGWMIERVKIRTSGIIARFTLPDPEAEQDETDASKKLRVLAFKPTHKAVFSGDTDAVRDDDLGMVFEALDSAANGLGSDGDIQRDAYLNMYYTECLLVWDKATRRVMLFHRDDWAWPLWVWDDPLKLTRFFPYFIMSFLMTIGSIVSPGEPAYYLDQQDEINEINAQIRRIRNGVFNFFFYNSDKIDATQAAKFLGALTGKTRITPEVIGVKLGDEGDVSKLFSAFAPPSVQYKELFTKEPIMGSINRLSATNDAMRGEQFKTNTTEDAVQAYQESQHVNVGSKVDTVEEVMSDIGGSLAELCIQNMTQQDVADLVGDALAASWKEMPLEQFKSTYSTNVVAGSTEKPTSANKKKEAVSIVQGLGQFAQGAPATAMRISMRVLSTAFSQFIVHQDDWDMLDKEMQAVMNKGNNDPASGGQAGAQGGVDPEQIIAQLPPQVKEQIVQMKAQGKSDQEIKAFIMQQVNGGGQQQPQQAPAPAAAEQQPNG